MPKYTETDLKTHTKRGLRGMVSRAGGSYTEADTKEVLIGKILSKSGTKKKAGKRAGKRHSLSCAHRVKRARPCGGTRPIKVTSSTGCRFCRKKRSF